MSYEEEIIRKITGKMSAIKRGELEPKDSGIGVLMNKLKEMNLPMYEEKMEAYKQVLREKANNDLKNIQKGISQLRK
jgi:hypothetical protein